MEGLWLMFKEGTYYLFYSASAFQLPTYRMMVARSDSLLGPYVKEHFSNTSNPHHDQRLSLWNLPDTLKSVRVCVCLRYLC